MQINVKEAARLLAVSEKTIYRWIRQGEIPAYRINDLYRFSRAELLEWATAKRLTRLAGHLRRDAEVRSRCPVLPMPSRPAGSTTGSRVKRSTRFSKRSWSSCGCPRRWTGSSSSASSWPGSHSGPPGSAAESPFPTSATLSCSTSPAHDHALLPGDAGGVRGHRRSAGPHTVHPGQPDGPGAPAPSLPADLRPAPGTVQRPVAERQRGRSSSKAPRAVDVAARPVPQETAAHDPGAPPARRGDRARRPGGGVPCRGRRVRRGRSGQSGMCAASIAGLAVDHHGAGARGHLVSRTSLECRRSAPRSPSHSIR